MALSPFDKSQKTLFVREYLHLFRQYLSDGPGCVSAVQIESILKDKYKYDRSVTREALLQSFVKIYHEIVEKEYESIGAKYVQSTIPIAYEPVPIEYKSDIDPKVRMNRVMDFINKKL